MVNYPFPPETASREKFQTVKEMGMTFKKHCSKSDIKSFYDPLIFLLTLFGTDIYDVNDVKTGRKNIIVQAVFYLLSICNLLTCIAILAFIFDGISQQTLSPLFLYYTDTLWRCEIHRKRKDFNRLINVLSDYKLPIEFKWKMMITRKKFCFAGASVLLFFLSLMVYAIVITLTSRCYEVIYGDTPNMSSNLKYIHSNFIFVLTLSIIVCCFTYHMMPIAVYALFFSAVLWHIKGILLEFDKNLKSSVFDVRTHHREYSRISSLVEFSDLTFNRHAFFCVLGISTRVYFTAFFIMRIDLTPERYGVASVLSLISFVSTIFTACSFATEIPSCNEDILKTVNRIPFDDDASVKRLAFSMQIQQGLHLTVGKIVPIRKGMLWTLAGTIATYSILIKSFSLR